MMLEARGRQRAESRKRLQDKTFEDEEFHYKIS